MNLGMKLREDQLSERTGKSVNQVLSEFIIDHNNELSKLSSVESNEEDIDMEKAFKTMARVAYYAGYTVPYNKMDQESKSMLKFKFEEWWKRTRVSFTQKSENQVR